MKRTLAMFSFVRVLVLLILLFAAGGYLERCVCKPQAPLPDEVQPAPITQKEHEARYWADRYDDSFGEVGSDPEPFEIPEGKKELQFNP